MHQKEVSRTNGTSLSDGGIGLGKVSGCVVLKRKRLGGMGPIGVLWEKGSL